MPCLEYDYDDAIVDSAAMTAQLEAILNELPFDEWEDFES